jgi:hypothetical protein
MAKGDVAPADRGARSGSACSSGLSLRLALEGLSLGARSSSKKSPTNFRNSSSGVEDPSGFRWKQTSVIPKPVNFMLLVTHECSHQRPYAIRLLNAHQYNELLNRVARDIQDYRVRVATTPDRYQRTEAMEALLNSLKAVSESVEHHKRVLDPILISDVLPVLGGLMSASGLAQLGRTGPIAWGLGKLELSGPGLGPTRDHGRGRDSARSLDPVHIDELTAPARARVAGQLGPKILHALLKSLEAPVERILAFEKRSRVGRPADVERNYVIEELATFYH